jgi:ketosteroid isomerase-like protein
LTGIAEKDRAATSACLADDVTWWVPQSAAEHGIERPLRGRESVLGLLCGKSRYEPGSMNWQCHHLVHDGDMVVAHCTLRAKTATGRTYQNEYALIYRFQGELIVESWEHTDTAYAFSRYSE